MTPTTNPPAVYRALRDAIASMPPIGKDSVNQEQGFRFRSIEDVMPHAKKAMVEHGLVMIPEVTAREVEKRSTARGSVIHVVHLQVTLTIVSVEDGSTIRTIAWGEGADMGDKATSKAMTMAVKSALLALMMVADDDPDAHTVEHTVAVRPARPQAKRPGAAPVDPAREELRRRAEQLGVADPASKKAIKAWADRAQATVADVLDAIEIGVLAVQDGQIVEVSQSGSAAMVEGVTR